MSIGVFNQFVQPLINLKCILNAVKRNASLFPKRSIIY